MIRSHELNIYFMIGNSKRGCESVQGYLDPNLRSPKTRGAPGRTPWGRRWQSRKQENRSVNTTQPRPQLILGSKSGPQEWITPTIEIHWDPSISVGKSEGLASGWRSGWMTVTLNPKTGSRGRGRAPKAKRINIWIDMDSLDSSSDPYIPHHPTLKHAS